VTDRIRHLTITLDTDYRDDDVEAIVQAIRLIRGVQHVDTRVVEGADDLARSAVRAELERDLHTAIDRVFTHKEFERSAADRRSRT
jgi:hypothetical protein